MYIRFIDKQNRENFDYTLPLSRPDNFNNCAYFCDEDDGNFQLWLHLTHWCPIINLSRIGHLRQMVVALPNNQELHWCQEIVSWHTIFL